MFYLQGKPDTGRNSTFASIRLFYLHVVAYLDCILELHVCSISVTAVHLRWTHFVISNHVVLVFVWRPTVTMKCTASTSNRPIRNSKRWNQTAYQVSVTFAESSSQPSDNGGHFSQIVECGPLLSPPFPILSPSLPHLPFPPLSLK